jgi:hypothetical protein
MGRETSRAQAAAWPSLQPPSKHSRTTQAQTPTNTETHTRTRLCLLFGRGLARGPQSCNGRTTRAQVYKPSPRRGASSFPHLAARDDHEWVGAADGLHVAQPASCQADAAARSRAKHTHTHTTREHSPVPPEATPMTRAQPTCTAPCTWTPPPRARSRWSRARWPRLCRSAA